MNIKTVTVVGANGTMGSNVSGIFAAFGNAAVYMVSRDMEKSKQAVAKAVRSVRADSIAKNLIPADYSMLAECVQKSDLVFESVAENLEIKLDITRKIAQYARPDAVLATGTSGLSINTLAESCPEHMRGRFFGVHMFNPPYNLTLCEVISTQYADAVVFAELKQYLKEKLYRTVVEVKDAPAFLGNRIGFQFINRALLFADQYKDAGGIDYIDAILGAFTGRSMPPLVTSDFVGLDVHKAIVKNVYDNAPDYARDTFRMPEYAEKLIAEGKLGRKAHGGLYKLEVGEAGSKRMMVYDISTDTYRDKLSYSFAYADQMKKAFYSGNYQKAFTVLVENQSAETKICLEFLLQYILYSLYAANTVGYSVHAADDVMATGFNWCPPLAMADALNTVTDVKALISKRLDITRITDFDVEAVLDSLEPSKYDYRPYFKSI